MTHASLFSGIGGFDLAAQLVGWVNVFNCEIDKFCQKVLKYHFPNAIQYGNIKTTDFSIWRGYVDVLTGGFPCQPFSVAGYRKGTDDDRYLWPEMLRAIQEIRPRWIVGENVRGFVSWSDGMVLETVCSDLENAGYEVQPFLIPACAVNAPHRRDRIWIVAHCDDTRAEDMRKEWHSTYKSENASDTDCNRQSGWEREQKFVEECSCKTDARIGCQKRDITNSDSERCNEFFASKESSTEKEWDCINDSQRRNQREKWDDFPTQSPVCCGDDGLPGRLDGITFPAWCRESIKSYGNAIVPDVAYRIFDAINRYEKLTENQTN